MIRPADPPEAAYRINTRLMGGEGCAAISLRQTNWFHAERSRRLAAFYDDKA